MMVAVAVCPLTPAPALAQVGAPRLLAHRAQLQLAQLLFYLHVLVPARDDALFFIHAGLRTLRSLSDAGAASEYAAGQRVALDEVVEPGAGREARAERAQAVGLGPLGRLGRRGGFRGETRASSVIGAAHETRSAAWQEGEEAARLADRSSARANMAAARGGERSPRLLSPRGRG